MEFLNVEIKAKYSRLDAARQILKDLRAEFKGTDHQIDTYFKVRRGRLKLRQGEIEQHLIYYKRDDQQNPKSSRVILYKSESNSVLKEVLTRSLGVQVIVDKRREIYFIDNVKFHLDSVKYLGTFMEIEAIDRDGKIGENTLHQQCQHYMKTFNISPSDLIACSYSDMLINYWK